MDIDIHSPRTQQAVAAAVVLLAFAVNFGVVVLLAELGLLVTSVGIQREYRLTWVAETGLFVVSALLFLVGRAGWAWVLALLAAGVAALAAAADVWILPDRGQVRRPK